MHGLQHDVLELMANIKCRWRKPKSCLKQATTHRRFDQADQARGLGHSLWPATRPNKSIPKMRHGAPSVCHSELQARAEDLRDAFCLLGNFPCSCAGAEKNCTRFQTVCVLLTLETSSFESTAHRCISEPNIA